MPSNESFQLLVYAIPNPRIRQAARADFPPPLTQPCRWYRSKFWLRRYSNERAPACVLLSDTGFSTAAILTGL